jgi:hypothetical protein
MVVHAYNTIYTGMIGGSSHSPGCWGIIARPYQNNSYSTKRAGSMTHMVESLPSKCRAFTPIKKKGTNQKELF